MRLATITLCTIVILVASLSGCGRSETAEPVARDQVGVSELKADQANEVQPTSVPKPNLPSQKSIDTESTRVVGSFEGTGHAKSTRRASFSRYSGSADSLSTRMLSVEGAKTPVASKAMIGKPLPVFSLNDIAGNTLTNESLKGKVVLLDFWAT